MYSNSTIRQIQTLLARPGMSQRKIAKILGISRGTVRNVATGRRGLMGDRHRLPDRIEEATVCTPTPCETCGALITRQPCLACRDRKLLAAGNDCRRRRNQPAGPIRIELDGEARKRYEQIHQLQLEPVTVSELTERLSEEGLTA